MSGVGGESEGRGARGGGELGRRVGEWEAWGAAGDAVVVVCVQWKGAAGLCVEGARVR